MAIPRALVVIGANRHDMKLLVAALDGIASAQPAPTNQAPQHLSQDVGYDYGVARAEVARGDIVHICPREEERALKGQIPG